MQKKRCLFIVNPISGLGKQKDLPELIHQLLDKDIYQYDIATTEYAGHAVKLAADYRQDFEVMVAVGGDGTINEVATSLIDSETALGVIPLGSGNGFARHMELSTQASRAIQQLNRCQPTYFDTGLLNGKPFFNVSGTGFDGQISKSFAEQLTRGYLSYARCVMDDIRTFVPTRYAFSLDGKEMEETYFLIAFANTSQYGNNAIIAPQARTDDGLLDIVFVKPFPTLHLPTITMMAMFKSLNKSPYVHSIKVSEFRLKNLDRAPIHIDGEYLSDDPDIEVSVKPGSLLVMAPVN